VPLAPALIVVADGAQKSAVIYGSTVASRAREWNARTCELRGGAHVAKGQVRHGNTNKPKLSAKEKAKKKQEKKAKKV